MCGDDVEIEPDDLGQSEPPMPADKRDQKQVASYVCDMTGSLKKLALDADMKFLAYLLDMAHIEAFNIVNGRAKNGEKDTN